MQENAIFIIMIHFRKVMSPLTATQCVKAIKETILAIGSIKLMKVWHRDGQKWLWEQIVALGGFLVALIITQNNQRRLKNHLGCFN